MKIYDIMPQDNQPTKTKKKIDLTDYPFTIEPTIKINNLDDLKKRIIDPKAS